LRRTSKRELPRHKRSPDEHVCVADKRICFGRFNLEEVSIGSFLFSASESLLVEKGELVQARRLTGTLILAILSYAEECQANHP